MKNRQKGQGLVEYILILVLVGVVNIAILASLSSAINDVFCIIQSAIGNPCPDSETKSVTAADGIQTTRSFTLDVDGENEDPFEAFETFGELVYEQDEKLDEVKILMSEGFDEALDVLFEFADDIGDQVLYELITQLQEAAAEGKYAGIYEILYGVPTGINDVPAAVQLAVVVKFEPLLIASYHELEGAQVPYNAFETALSEIELRGTDEAVEQMWVLWGLVENRNIFIDEVRPALKVIACRGIALLENSGDPGYIELAEGYEAEIGPCE